MRYLPIGELADKARVRASALRYWEERGLLPGARREGGRRVWPATTVRRVALIKMAQRAGFTLAEITQLLAEDTTPSATRQWRDMATRKLPELDRHIAQTQALRQAVADCLECGCMKFDQCVLLDNHRRGALTANTQRPCDYLALSMRSGNARRHSETIS